MSILEEKEKEMQAMCENVKHIRKVMCSQKGVDAMNDLRIAHFTAFEPFINNFFGELDSYANYSIAVSPRNMTVYLDTAYTGYYKDWEEIGGLVNDTTFKTNEFKYEFIKEIIVDNVVFHIGDYLVAKLPEEDMHFLIQMGKVKEHIVPSKIERSMVC